MEHSLAGFMAQKAETIEVEKVAVSRRFKDENGNPILWEIRPITTKKDEEIRKYCTKRVKVPGKPGVMVPQLDSDQYIGMMAAECTVYPELNSAKLQESYHACGPDALLKAMLLPGEYANFAKKIQEINGFDETMDEKVTEAKN